MRALTIVVLLSVASVCPAEQQRALPDHAYVMYKCIAMLVAAYYVAHEAWPTSTPQLHQYVASFQPSLRPKDQRVFAEIWSSIKHLEFRQRGRDLILTARFHSGDQDFSYASVIHPGH